MASNDCIVENWINNMWRNHKVLFSSGLVILLLWIVAGACLYFSGDDNFMSDLFSAGSAIGTVGAVVSSLYFSSEALKRENNAENRQLLRNGMKLLNNYAYSDKQIMFNRGYDNVDLLSEIITDFTLKFGTENNTVNNLIEQIKSANELAKTLFELSLEKHGNKIFPNSNWESKPPEEQDRWKEQIHNDHAFSNTLLEVFNDKKHMEQFNQLKHKYYEIGKSLMKM